MKKRIYKIANLLLGSVVTMLGFGSCSHDGDEIDNLVGEYGMPHATYRIIGTVTDEDGKPIEGIKVKAMRIDIPISSAYTDADGKYQIDEFEDMDMDYWGSIAFIDEDGEKNGAFLNDTIPVKGLPRTQYEERERWYTGAFEITADNKLKKEE